MKRSIDVIQVHTAPTTTTLAHLIIFDWPDNVHTYLIAGEKQYIFQTYEMFCRISKNRLKIICILLYVP